MPTQRQLEIFVTLAECGSMRRAADKLGISQPSISKQIRALENSLGGALVLRTRGERATLSALGIDLLQDARASLALHQRMTTKPFRPELHPRLYVRAFMYGIIHASIDRLRAAGLPDDMVFLISDDPFAAARADKSASPALALAGSLNLPMGADLLRHVVKELDCSIYVAPNLAAQVADGRLAMRDLPVLVPANQQTLLPWLSKHLDGAGLSRDKQIAKSQLVDLVVEDVSAGRGAGIFLDLHVARLVKEGRLVSLGRIGEPVLLVLAADHDVDEALFAQVWRALHALG